MSSEVATDHDDTRTVEELRRELATALEQQSATREILGVISSSPTDVGPVFEAILENASRLCHSQLAAVFRFDGTLLHLVATKNWPAEALKTVASRWPMPPDPRMTSGQVVLTKDVILQQDTLADPSYDHSTAHAGGWRRMLGVPMLRDGKVVGVIIVTWREPGPISPKQVGLLKTFADQAVIAIENTRLFEEVRERTQDLQESLEYQTATSEILRVISSSPTDVEPVFDTISSNALRLCGASFSAVLLFDGEVIRLKAPHNLSDHAAIEALRGAFPRRPQPGGATDRAILTGSIAHIPDVAEDPGYQHHELSMATGYRSVLSVPMIRKGRPVGAITVAAASPGAFSEGQVSLLQTFADQAVIAIENARLFNETKEALERQTAISEILRVISRSPSDIQPVLDAVAERAARICEARIADVFFATDNKIILAATFGDADRPFGEPVQLDRTTVMGRSIVDGLPVHVADLHNAGDDFPLGQRLALRFGHRTILAVPLVRENRALGTILVRRFEVRPFEDKHIALLKTFADQAAIAIENVRLFNEIVQKSRELEIASQHKSQFVANMSHELRTPLAAILGYAELMQEGFYEPQGKKSLDALTRIRSNGKHLLGLINTVLDIAKIESGQFSLNLAEYALENVVETVRAATESLAATKKLALTTGVGKLPIGIGDEQRLTQVLLNLVGNAIKFTDAGEVRVSADAQDGHFTVAVTDTGPGIPGEEQSRIFEQFHQVDSSNTKAKGGTGLGLAIAKQIVEMHGGRIWVESMVGKGATFQMRLPIRAEARSAS